MPVRPMKESIEQHLVIKTQVQNSMTQVQKNQKILQNGKGPPPFESQNGKVNHQNSPPTKNRGRRRGRGGRKSDQSDIPMRPSSRPCTIAEKTLKTVSTCPMVAQSVEDQNGSVENGGHVCEMDMGVPSSSKSLRFAPRPGFGQAGTKCVVKANHFFAQLPEKDLHQYDVSCVF